MKTITAIYRINGKEIGSLSGKFRQFPGEGPLTWGNPIELERRLKLPLLMIGDAMNFRQMVEHVGKLLGAETTVNESGDWEEIPQDDLIEP
jgi:hypothetical protein